jgi:hypothetical protein
MNGLKQIARLLLPPLLLPRAWGSSFESANWSPRRGSVPGASPTDARNELTPGVRSELVRKSRYLHKNSGFMREPSKPSRPTRPGTAAPRPTSPCGRPAAR